MTAARVAVALGCALAAAAARPAHGRPAGCAERASLDARDGRLPRPPGKADTDPNLYVDALDSLVTYDDLLAERDYDDGYTPDASKAFEAALAPYGTWADTVRLGRVWFPSESATGPGFVPYGSGGRWALTEYGWTWVSEWSWGWAPFHYGRWVVLPGRGWCWVPGTLWGPAWVAWRQGRAYVAWAPLPPRGMSLGRPLGPRSPWSMARTRALGAPTTDCVPRRLVPSLFSRTTAFSNRRQLTSAGVTFLINAGPARVLCCGQTQPAAHPLAQVAPGARPHGEVPPARGAPAEARPWVRRGFVAQTPVWRWPAPGAPSRQAM